MKYMNTENNEENKNKIIIEDDFTMFPGTIGEVKPDVKIPRSFIITEAVGAVFFILSLFWTIQNLGVQCGDSAVCSLNSMVAISISGLGVFIGAVVILLGFWLLSRTKPEVEEPAALISSLIDIENKAKEASQNEDETSEKAEENPEEPETLK